MIPDARWVLLRSTRSLAAAIVVLLASHASFAQPANETPATPGAPPSAAAAPAQPTVPPSPSDYVAPPGYAYPPPGYAYPPPGYAYPPPATWPAQPPYPPELYGNPPNAPPVATAATLRRDEAAPLYSLGATLATSYEHEPGSTSVVFSPLLEGALLVHPLILLDLTWGLGWLVDGQGLSESTARVGNPMLSGFYRANVGPWRVRAGLGVTAPLAHLPLSPDGRLYAFVYNQTQAMWGLWNQWLWDTDRMAVPAMARGGYVLAGGSVLVAEAALAPVICVRGSGNCGKALPQPTPTNPTPGPPSLADKTDWLGQLAIEAHLPVSTSFALCPRLQTVLLPSTSVDRFQSAAGLRMTMQTQSGRYFAFLLLNLDEPLGIFRGLERWGFHFGKELDL
jgi:hypothetical protein